MRIRAALRTLWIGVVVAVGLSALVPTCGRPPAYGATLAPGGRPSDVAASVDLVDRLRARFQETLDFAPLVDEFFVDGVGVRNANAGSFAEALAACGVASELVERLDEADARRAFIAYMNVAHLALAFSVAAHDARSDVADDAVVPPAVAQRMYGSRVLRRLLNDDDAERDAPPMVLTHEEFLALVDDLEAVADGYRRLVSARTFEEPRYVANLEAFGLAREGVDVSTSDASSGYPRFGIASGARVVEVAREMFWYDVILEDGAPKILTVQIAGD
jgi:hypothetical protein